MEHNYKIGDRFESLGGSNGHYKGQILTCKEIRGDEVVMEEMYGSENSYFTFNEIEKGIFIRPLKELQYEIY